MTLELPRSDQEEMPEPSVELALIGVFVRTLIAEMPVKKRRAFMERLFENFSEMEDMEKIIRIRPRKFDDAVRKSRRQANAWAKAMLTAHFMLGAKK